MSENSAEFPCPATHVPSIAAAAKPPNVDAASQPLDAVRALAGAIVHELNNPLAAIQLSTATARKSLPDGPAGEALSSDLDVITEAAERCAVALGQIARFARQQPLQSAPKKLTSALHSIQESLGNLSPSANRSSAG